MYIGSQLVYTCGALLMALTRHPVMVILLSPTSGIMYATLFTMPYLLVAHYHSSNTVRRTCLWHTITPVTRYVVPARGALSLQHQGTSIK